MPEIIAVDRIWDKAPHNAFTDLVRFGGAWYCVFREGTGHVSLDGALRVITSPDGVKWTSAARIASEAADLRDAKITVTPGGSFGTLTTSKLMLAGAAALHPPADAKHQSMVWLSDGGRKWSEAVEVGDKDYWLWRVTWREGRVYGIGYSTTGTDIIRLYRSDDGQRFETLVEDLGVRGYANESSIVFDPAGQAFCLLRRDGKPGSAMLGTAGAPYTKWAWNDLGVRIGGPHIIQLPGERFFAVVRLYDDRQRTSLCTLDVAAGRLTELLALPSGGDTSYAGLVFHDGLLWISYYSSHEDKTAIYLAKLALPA